MIDFYDKNTGNTHSSSARVVDACINTGVQVAYWATQLRLRLSRRGTDAKYGTIESLSWQLRTAERQRQNAYRDLVRGVKFRSLIRGREVIQR